VLYCRTPDASESSKAIEQKFLDVLATPSLASASAPPTLVGASLMACTYNDTRSSAQHVLCYLESFKDVEVDRKGNRSSLTASNYLYFDDRILYICAALSAKLEAANKALAKERAVQQVVDHTLQAS
jgi:hypothetical protein